MEVPHRYLKPKSLPDIRSVSPRIIGFGQMSGRNIPTFVTTMGLSASLFLTAANARHWGLSERIR
jgi:hypothetical protein